MKALVIGGTGPTGPYIVDGLIERGYEVTVLHRGHHEVEFARPVEHIHTDPYFMQTLEAALGNRTFDLCVSTYGRLRIVAPLMKGRTPRLVAVGGAGSYRAVVHPPGPVGIPIPIPEDAPLNRDRELDNFTYLMVVSEEVLMEHHKAGHYNATVLRYPIIYGPRQLGPTEWCIMKRVQDGRKQIIIPSSGMALVARGYAENMAYTALLAVDKPKESAGQVYNVADDTQITVREFIERIAEVMGHRFELIDIPFGLARPARAYAGRGHHWFLDLTKIKTELGYKDPVPVDEAMKRTVEWWLAHPPEEGRLNDPFDYAAEDAYIAATREYAGKLREIPFELTRRGPGGYRHGYASPGRPMAPDEHPPA